MSLAAILWAMVAMMQLCMTSQSGMKKLGYPFLSFHYAQALLKIYSVICLALSLYLNCLDHGLSVGIITWIFLIITSGFFYNFYCIITLNDGFFRLDVFIFLSVLYSLTQYS